MHPRRAGCSRGATRWGRVGALLALTGFFFTGGPGLLSAANQPAEASTGPSVAELVFFGRLHELVQAKKWTEATRHIQQLQALRNEPEWLAPRAGELRFAQIQISRGQGDPTGVLNAARLYLNGDDVRSQRLLQFAQELYAAEEKTSAIALVKEITGRTPGFAPAQRVLAEWVPPPAPKPKKERKVATLPVPPRAGAADGSVKAPAERTSVPATEEDEAAAHLAFLRKSHELGNLPGVLAAARLYLTGDRDRAEKMLEIAREFRARDEPRLALLLTQEVLRRTPRFGPAQRLLAELEAPAPKP